MNELHHWAQWTHLWFCAAERQESRLELRADGTAYESEFFLYVDALRKVLRGAERVLGRKHTSIVEFHAVAPDVRHVRNMIEQFDEYVVGKGGLQATASGLRAPFLVMTAGGSGTDHWLS